MKYSSCPTDEIAAPIEIVWDLLTDPSGWGNVFDVKITKLEPQGRAAIGQRVHGEWGPAFLHLKVRFEYRLIDPVQYRLCFDGLLPLGIQVHEDLQCVRVDSGNCRVSYRCDFEFPKGLLSWVTKQFLLKRGLPILWHG